jgi:hypothetical protein
MTTVVVELGSPARNERGSGGSRRTGGGGGSAGGRGAVALPTRRGWTADGPTTGGRGGEARRVRKGGVAGRRAAQQQALARRPVAGVVRRTGLGRAGSLAGERRSSSRQSGLVEVVGAHWRSTVTGHKQFCKRCMLSERCERSKDDVNKVRHSAERIVHLDDSWMEWC